MTTYAPVWGVLWANDQLKVAVKIPPSVNRMYRAVGGRVIVSAPGREWKREAKAEIMRLMPPHLELPLKPPYGLEISFRPPDARLQDIDNRLKPSLDFLQYTGIITNDSEIVILRVVKKPSEGRDKARLTMRVWTVSPSIYREMSRGDGW